MNENSGITDIEKTLDSFGPAVRQAALKQLAESANVRQWPAGSNVNMHLHSFFSYNAQGYSPMRLVWEARKAGLYAAGLCDFDVLDGLDEFLDAALAVGLRATVNLETRAYLKEFGEVDINSPGEPGVTYVMGAGFVRLPAAGSPQAAGLDGYRERARERNLSLIERINARLGDIAIDYARDVLPLTPGGTATERHIMSAYAQKARTVFGSLDGAAAFWAPLVGQTPAATIGLMNDAPRFDEVVRSKLAKRGGIGYVQPSVDTFPSVDEFIRWVASCDAIPMMTWLDGTSAGEGDPRAMLECMRAKGAEALNIIPDRNWNYSDPQVSAQKQAHLKAIIEAADSMHIPINIGTEMNKQGLPFVDDLAGPALAPFKESFLQGARVMVGHSLLARYADYSFTGQKVAADFGDDRGGRNRMFAAVGALAPLTCARAAELEEMGPEKALDGFKQESSHE